MFAQRPEPVKCDHRRVPPIRAPLAALAVCATLLAACGGGEGTDTGPSERFPDADPAAVAVIDEWSGALRGGDVAAAAGYFARPSIAENGSVLIRIETDADAEAFNESLPCGATLVDATTKGDFTTATFELSERPGPGSCGSGVGALAKTSFIISDGKIAEWRRVGLVAPPSQGPSV